MTKIFVYSTRQVRKRVPGGQADALPAPDAPGRRRHPLAAPAAAQRAAVLATSPPALAAQQQRRGLAHAVLGGRLAADQGHRLGRLKENGNPEIGPIEEGGDVAAVCSHVRTEQKRREEQEDKRH